jgi:hypothetical protein
VNKFFFVIFALTLLFPFLVKAQTPSDKYPRTANYYLLSGRALESQATISTLANFDLLVLPAEAQIYNKTFFSEIRERHPDIIILAYIPSVSYNNTYWNDTLKA